MNSLSDQLRQAIVERGEPQYAVAHGCGLTRSTLSRFLSGKGGLSLDAAGRVAAYLKLVLVRADGVQARAGASTLP